MRVLPSITLIAAGTATAVLSTACGGDPPSGPPPDPPPMATIVQGYVRSYADSTPVSGLRVTACERWLGWDPIREAFRETYKELASSGSQGDGSYNLSFTASCRLASSVFLTVAARPGSSHWRRAITSNGRICDQPDIQSDLWVETPAPIGYKTCPPGRFSLSVPPE